MIDVLTLVAASYLRRYWFEARAIDATPPGSVVPLFIRLAIAFACLGLFLVQLSLVGGG